MFVVLSLIERRRKSYVGYYDWPNRSWDEYVAAVDHYYVMHSENIAVDKVSKPSVNYREAEDIKRSCRTCGMFKPHQLYKGESGTCELVLGAIFANDTCNEWVRRNA